MMNNLSIQAGESETTKVVEPTPVARPQQQQAPQTRAPAVIKFDMYLDSLLSLPHLVVLLNFVFYA